jgi:hypothetical protein
VASSNHASVGIGLHCALVIVNRKSLQQASACMTHQHLHGIIILPVNYRLQLSGRRSYCMPVFVSSLNSQVLHLCSQPHPHSLTHLGAHDHEALIQ